MMVPHMSDCKMIDWKMMARAIGLEMSDEDLKRTVAPLASLQTAFQSASATLTPANDPAVVFDPAQEDSAV